MSPRWPFIAWCVASPCSPDYPCARVSTCDTYVRPCNVAPQSRGASMMFLKSISYENSITYKHGTRIAFIYGQIGKQLTEPQCCAPIDAGGILMATWNPW